MRKIVEKSENVDRTLKIMNTACVKSHEKCFFLVI